jgi:hypothetical protein
VWGSPSTIFTQKIKKHAKAQSNLKKTREKEKVLYSKNLRNIALPPRRKLKNRKTSRCRILMRWFGGLPHSFPDAERNNSLQGAGAMQKKIVVVRIQQ